MIRNVLLSVLLVAILAVSLGVPLASAQAEQPSEPGLVIVRVDPSGPAAEAGVKRGDILLALGGQEINSAADWLRALRSLKTGEPVDLQVLHGDEQRTLPAVIAERNSRAFLGLQVYLGAAEDTTADEPLLLPLMTPAMGAQVMEVVADSPASAAGLLPGDLITAVDGKALDGEGSLADVIAGYQPDDEVALTITRDGTEQTLTITLGEHPDDASLPFLGIRYTNTLEMSALPDQLMPFFQRRGDDRGMPFQLPFGQQTTPFELPFGEQTTPGQTLTAGALVRTVVEASPAAEAGLQAGDVITAVDGEAVVGPQALLDAISARQPGDVVTLTVTRTGADEALEIDITLGENPEAAGRAYLGVSIGAAMLRFQGRTPDSDQGGMRFRLPFDLGELQLDPDKLPFDLDRLPFKLPVPPTESSRPQA